MIVPLVLMIGAVCLSTISGALLCSSSSTAPVLMLGAILLLAIVFWPTDPPAWK